MTNKTIKINFGQISTIIIFLLVLVLVGSIMDIARTQQKYKLMIQHGSNILDSYKNGIVRILANDETINSKLTLNDINRPKNGTYNIYVVKKEDKDVRFYLSDISPITTDSNLHNVLLSPEQTAEVLPYLKEEPTSGRLKSLDTLFWDQNNLYSFIPVFNGELVGYVVVRVVKNKNI